MNGPPTCDVAILAGGRGLRLSERAGSLPKPMVPVLGVPALEYQIALCRRFGFERVLLLVHHAHEDIQRHFGDGSRHGISIEYLIDAAPRGTGGALRDALPRLRETCLVLYGDTFVDVDLRRLWEAHVCSAAAVTLFVHPNDHPADSDLVETDATGAVSALHPYPHPPDAEHDNLAVAALFVLQSAVLTDSAPVDAPSDLVKDVLPAALRRGQRLFAYISPEYIRDFGTPARLDQVERDIRSGLPERLSGRRLRPAVFFDRDGTLNQEVSYVTRPEQLELLPRVPDAVRSLNAAGYLSVVITNQAVIARGDLTADGLAVIHRRLTALLGRHGAYLDAIYVCPHHPDRGFPGEVSALKIQCDCRKPRTGSIDAACRDLLIDRRASWLVGDTTSDIEAGRRSGLRTVLVRTGHAGSDGRFPFRPDYVTADAGAAVRWILQGHAVLSRRLARVSAAAVDARLLLVGGLARSGKSFAAQILREQLASFGCRAHVLSMDSWLKPQADRSESTGVVSRFDVDAALGTVRSLAEATEPRTIDVPIYDRTRRAMYERSEQVTVDPDDVVILEGVPALLVEELVALADVRVHLEMPEADRLALLREDYRWRGTTDAAVDALVASRARDETPLVLGARGHADFVVQSWNPA